MADPVVEDFIRTINGAVVDDTKGRSLLVGDELPALDLDDGRLEYFLRRLAVNRDVPAKLAPSVTAILDRDSGQDDEAEAFRPTYDERPAIGYAVEHVVAASAFSMAAQELVPPAGDPEGRDNLEWNAAKAYAALATRQRIVPKLLVNGQRDDLGIIPLPDETGGAVAYRALVLGITARTRLDEVEVQRSLIRAGRGCTALAAARMLLDTNPTYNGLDEAAQQGVARRVAAEMERGFATERPLPTIENAMAYTIVERALAAEWGAGVVNEASSKATKEAEVAADDAARAAAEAAAAVAAAEEAGLAPAVEPPVPAGLPTDRPVNLPELMHRIQGAVAGVTGAPESLSNHRIEPLEEAGLVRASADGTLLLDRDDAALPLFDLTQEDPLDPEQFPAMRQAIQKTTEAYIEWAVPEGHTPASEAPAPRYNAVNAAVRRALAEDVQDQIIRHALPAGDADQLLATDSPYSDLELAPAARRFALVVDNLKGHETNPSETLRRMAGQDHLGAGRAVGQVLVANSSIPDEFRPAAVRMIGETVVDGFAELADRKLSASLTATEMADASRNHGRDLGRLVDAMVRVYADNPKFAQQDRAATERRAAAAIGLPVRQTVRLERPTDRAAGPRELTQRIEGAVGMLTGQPQSLWNKRLGSLLPGDGFAPSAEGTLRVGRLGDLSVVQLTAEVDAPVAVQLRGYGELTQDELRNSRDHLFDTARACTQWNVPAGHTREDELQAEEHPQYTAIGESVRDGFVIAEFDEIVDGVLPPHLAEQVKAVGPPTHGTASAPAARGLAQSIDEITRRGTNPSETLRQLAGQPRADIAPTAAELLVDRTDAPVADQPVAVKAAAERIDRAFQMLPAQIEAWQDAGTTNEDLVVKVHDYGYAVGREAYALVGGQSDITVTIAANRGTAQGAQADASLRFVPGHDLASARSGTVQAPDGVQAANPGAASGQAKAREYDGRT
jgi:hypothetical protein